MKIFPLKSLLKKSKESGFTLIEMAVVLIIIGVIISAMSATLPLILESAKIKRGVAELEKIDYALELALISNGRYPCPDTNGDGVENRILGSNTPFDDTCSAYVGDLPYLTLGLSDAEDPWQRTIRYGVYLAIIRTTGGTGSTSLCNVIKMLPPTTPSTSRIYTTIGGVNTNQAYILVSGGPADANKDGVFFDGLNVPGDAKPLQFEDPDRLPADNYDDILKAVSFSYIAGKECVGTETGGIPGGGGENTFLNGCIDTIDNDMDGAADCADLDCATDPVCVSSAQVTVTAAPLPSGYFNDNYTTTIGATGGQPPYTWELLDNGGFTDFIINEYTGTITGTLNQCPGTYTIQVEATDSAPAPSTDTESFDITVDKNIAIGGNSTINWVDPTWEEPYNASGEYIGTPITWGLTTDGADGFTYTSTGDDSCVIKKTGATTTGPGPYTFNLTATDPDCSATNTVTKPITVTLSAGGVYAPVVQNAVAWWKLDGCVWDGTSGEVVDSGPDLLHGVAAGGAVTNDTGKVCRSGSFDGSNDYLNMGSILDNIFGRTSDAFTVTMWVNPSALTTAQTNHVTQNTFFAKASDAYNDNIEIGVNATGNIHLYLDTWTGGDTYANFGPAGAVPLDTWTFVAVSYDNGTVAVTINGTRYENTTTWSGGFIDQATNSPVTIGDSEHINNYFTGKIDEVLIFSTALSPSDVASVYNSTSRTCVTCP